MKSWKHRRAGRRSGMAATELALLLPVLLYGGLITTDYSRVFYTLATLSDAARAGAVYYATHATATASAIQAVALADAGNISPSPTVASTSWTDSAGNTYVQVTISCTFRTVAANPSIPSSTALSRSVVMMANPS